LGLYYRANMRLLITILRIDNV